MCVYINYMLCLGSIPFFLVENQSTIVKGEQLVIKMCINKIKSEIDYTIMHEGILCKTSHFII